MFIGYCINIVIIITDIPYIEVTPIYTAIALWPSDDVTRLYTVGVIYLQKLFMYAE